MSSCTDLVDNFLVLTFQSLNDIREKSTITKSVIEKLSVYQIKLILIQMVFLLLDTCLRTFECQGQKATLH